MSSVGSVLLVQPEGRENRDQNRGMIGATVTVPGWGEHGRQADGHSWKFWGNE